MKHEEQRKKTKNKKQNKNKKQRIRVLNYLNCKKIILKHISHEKKVQTLMFINFTNMDNHCNTAEGRTSVFLKLKFVSMISSVVRVIGYICMFAKWIVNTNLF
jgi:hypothetical protein